MGSDPVVSHYRNKSILKEPSDRQIHAKGVGIDAGGISQRGETIGGILQRKVQLQGTVDLNEFMWADYRKGVRDSDFFFDRLKIYTSEHMMHVLGFQEYRQVATAFMEKHLNYQVHKSERNLNQAGHSSRTAGMEYARSTEDNRQVSGESMHKLYLVSKELQRLLLCQASETINEMSPVGVYRDGLIDTISESDHARCVILPDSSESSKLQ